MESQGPTNGDAHGFSIIEQKLIADTYTDAVQFLMNAWGVTLEFGIGQPAPPGFVGQVPPVPRVRVHMSPQHAKIMAKLLVKNVQEWEKQVGKIDLPKALYEQYGIEDEW
jgi:hypothetical protein